MLEPAGKTKHVDYAIRKGVWKFNQYYDLRPGRKEGVRRFHLDRVHNGRSRKLDYVEVTGGWNVVLGGDERDHRGADIHASGGYRAHAEQPGVQAA